MKGRRRQIKKCTNTLRNRDGIALIATLILGMIAISFTLTMVYLAREGTRVGGVEGRYQAALQAANGGADLMIDFIRHYSGTSSQPARFNAGSLVINDGSNGAHHYPDTNTRFNVTLGNYLVSVTITKTQCTIESTTFKCLHNIVSQATNTSSANEKATVEVLYKVTY